MPDIAQFEKRVQELETQMAEPAFFQDARRAATVSRENQMLTGLIEDFQQLEKLHQQILEGEALAADPETDSDMREMAEEELPAMRKLFAKAKQDVLFKMLPPDPSDSRNTIIEIRAGTGGDEASLFAGDLFRMYSRFVETQGWKVEILGGAPTEAGGYKEVSFLVTGEDVYKKLKFESGVHRVQRVPATEASGRIHTSAATVAILPEAEDVDIEIDPNDLEITTCRASGAGGQHVNKTDSAVQMFHKPSGMAVYCADERSQHKNRMKALKVLRSRLLQKKEDEEKAAYAAHRRNQIGSGDRSERIRTYNFPQGRLSDHRINLTLYSLGAIMEGNLDEVISALQQADQEERLAELVEKTVS